MKDKKIDLFSSPIFKEKERKKHRETENRGVKIQLCRNFLVGINSFYGYCFQSGTKITRKVPELKTLISQNYIP